MSPCERRVPVVSGTRRFRDAPVECGSVGVSGHVVTVIEAQRSRRRLSKKEKRCGSDLCTALRGVGCHALPGLGFETPASRGGSGRSAYLIRNSSRFALLPLVAAAIQRGIRPRPVQVSEGFLGLRYLGATFPPLPPRPIAWGCNQGDWPMQQYPHWSQPARRCW